MLTRDRIAERPQGQWKMQRVNGFAERNIAPIELGPAHIDGDAAVGALFGIQQPGLGFDDQMIAVHLVHQQSGYAARGVAAGLHLAAIGVEYPHGDVGQPGIGLFDNDHLVEAHSPVPLRRCRARGPRSIGPALPVRRAPRNRCRAHAFL